MRDEKKEFLKKCSKTDREKLLGQRNMTLEDFERFFFLTEALGYPEVQKEIFNLFIPQFSSSYAEIQKLWEKEEPVWEEVESEVEKRRLWLEAFLKENE